MLRTLRIASVAAGARLSEETECARHNASCRGELSQWSRELGSSVISHLRAVIRVYFAVSPGGAHTFLFGIVLAASQYPVKFKSAQNEAFTTRRYLVT